jgi:hypothetical protein
LFDLVLCQKDGNVVCFGSAIVGEVASTSATSGEPPNASRGASASEVSSGYPKEDSGSPPEPNLMIVAWPTGSRGESPDTEPEVRLHQGFATALRETSFEASPFLDGARGISKGWEVIKAH